MTKRVSLGVLMLFGWLITSPCQGAEPSGRERFLSFIRAQAAALQADNQPPRTKEEWIQQRERIRQRLELAWGGFPETACPLEPRELGVIQRDGYRVEKLVFQTMPGVWMTALAYVPDAPGKHPAILSVHGHWRQAKVEPTIQSRCIGAVKLGFFVLAVDAFGAGERGIGKELGEYHGEMVGATLLPIGRPLSGIQVYENMRAVDYLQSRPEVDSQKIGITGASGGGNQTMYAGAWDERFGAVVPVCSVGNYQAYLGPACCMCEVVPGALRFTEEWGVLGLTAPRALMPCNVTRDGIQFSIREARKSIVAAQFVYDVLGEPDGIYHSTFRWKHDYHQPIREAMYGWMTQHLKGDSDGSPIAEPPHETEDPEQLRCFPGSSRPDDWLTLPHFAAREGRQLLAERRWPVDANGGLATDALRRRLLDDVLGGLPSTNPLNARISNVEGTSRRVEFQSEPGIELAIQSADPEDDRLGNGKAVQDVVLLLDLNGAAAASKSPLVSPLRARGCLVVTLDLRATGALAVEGDTIGRAPDHNSAEWSLWIGRPLLGQWTWDVLRAREALHTIMPATKAARFHVVGQGPAGLVALCAGAATDGLSSVAAWNTLASYITETPYVGQRLGTLAPGLLRDVGDVAHLAGLTQAPRVVFAGGVDGAGNRLDREHLASALAPAQEAARLRGTPSGFVLLDGGDADQVAAEVVR